MLKDINMIYVGFIPWNIPDFKSARLRYFLHKVKQPAIAGKAGEYQKKRIRSGGGNDGPLGSHRNILRMDEGRSGARRGIDEEGGFPDPDQ